MEEHLKDLHARNYTGTDDDMPDSFQAYLVNLDVDEWIKLANEYAKYVQIDMSATVINISDKLLENKNFTLDERTKFVHDVLNQLSGLEN
jgi:hypothetical protein